MSSSSKASGPTPTSSNQEGSAVAANQSQESPADANQAGGSSNGNAEAGSSRYRSSTIDSGEESAPESISTLASTESSFLRIRNTPAEEVESAASWRIQALRGKLNKVSVEEDDDMEDAEGEPASETEAEKN